jgi:hypothetical protein
LVPSSSQAFDTFEDAFLSEKRLQDFWKAKSPGERFASGQLGNFEKDVSTKLSLLVSEGDCESFSEPPQFANTVVNSSR